MFKKYKLHIFIVEELTIYVLIYLFCFVKYTIYLFILWIKLYILNLNYIYFCSYNYCGLKLLNKLLVV